MIRSNSDFDNLKSSCIKQFESSHAIIRQAAARCLAQSLVQLLKIALIKPEAQLKSLVKRATTTSLVRKPSQRAVRRRSADNATSIDSAGEEEPIDRSKTSTPGSVAGTGKSKIMFFALTFSDILHVLTTSYMNGHQTVRMRTGIVECFAYVLKSIDSGLIRANYIEVATSLFNMLSHPSIGSSKYHSIVAKRHTIFILNDVIAKQAFGEIGQLNVIKVLSNEVLNNYPAVMPHRVEPSKEALVTTLECITELIRHLGSAASSICNDFLRQPLMRLLQHPSYSVRTSACVCFKSFIGICPNLILSIETAALNLISKELLELSTTEQPARASGEKKEAVMENLRDLVVGHAHAVAIIVGMTSSRVLYSSPDLTSRVLATATSLLKSNEGTVEKLATQVEVSWILISGLMTLGPTFIKIHLAQFSLLWKAALTAPMTVGKDNIADKNTFELNYRLHTRKCALNSVLAFLRFNPKLVTGDVAKRIATMLQQTTLFISSIPAKRFLDEELSNRLNSKLSLNDYKTMVERRILQCYNCLTSFNFTRNIFDMIFPPNLLTSTLATFADPERNTNSKMSTAIATSAGQIESIWDLADNSAFGLTSKIQGYNVRTEEKFSDANDDEDAYWLTEGSWVGELESLAKTPVLSSPEFDLDYYVLYSSPAPMPLSTAVVDLSIQAFCSLFFTQTAKVQESILDQMQTCVLTENSTNGVASSATRKNAVLINSIVTMYEVLKRGLKGESSGLDNPRIIKIFFEILKIGVSNPDSVVRNIAAQSIGMLCNIGGPNITIEYVKVFVDTIVANTDPNTRGGCSMSLGYIVKYGSGRAHLKTVIGILISLAMDPHPVVHFWALEALAISIAGSGLSFSQFTSSTLSNLVKLLLLESHGDEMPSGASSNLDVELTYLANCATDSSLLHISSSSRIIAKCFKALINVFGPDLRDLNIRNRDFVVSLITQFGISSDLYVVLESFQCLQDMIIFAPEFVDLKSFSGFIQERLNDDSKIVRECVVDGLYQLIRIQSAETVFELGNADLKDDIWLAFNGNGNDELQRFIESWLDQTAYGECFDWISRIQDILLKTRMSFSKEFKIQGIVENSVAGNTTGDEGESFAKDGSENSNNDGERNDGELVVDEPLRWQTRSLAVKLLRRLVQVLLKGKSLKDKEQSPIVAKIGDVIKVAFSASTSPIIDLRLLGLRLLDEVLFEMKDLVDPDFPTVALLEQYQAQISSALTPAFASDSCPELAFQAIKVCATFIGSGIIKNVSRMGRILRILTGSLESIKLNNNDNNDTNNTSNTDNGGIKSLGDLKTESSNAQVVLKIAVLSLWAELQVCSISKDFLSDVVNPHVGILIPLWISSLRDYAKLRFEPEQSSSGLATSEVFNLLSRSSILPVYEKSWLHMVNAIASLIEQDRKLVIEILDEEEWSDDIKYSNEPAAFFFVLFGLCFEALVHQQSSGSTSREEVDDLDKRLRVLVALNRILRPSVCGNTIYQDVVFAETIDMLDRIILTSDNLQEHGMVVNIALNLCLNHHHYLTNNDQVTESVDQLFELFRVVMLALTNLCPFLTNTENNGGKNVHVAKLSRSKNGLFVIKKCLDSLVEMIEMFPNIIKVDLYACLLYTIGQFVENDHEIYQKMIMPFVLVIEKRLLERIVKTHKDNKQQGPKRVIRQAIVATAVHDIALFKNQARNNSSVDWQKNCLLSITIILGTGASILDSIELGSYYKDLAHVLLHKLSINEGKTKEEEEEVFIECTKKILGNTMNTRIGKIISQIVLPGLLLNSNKQKIPSRITCEMFVVFTKSLKENEEVTTALAITVPLLLSNSSDQSSFVNDKIVELAQFDSAAFKQTVQNGLNKNQRIALEKILRGDNEPDEETVKVDAESSIALKMF